VGQTGELKVQQFFEDSEIEGRGSGLETTVQV
jgi:hypothetical protein